ncbi:MAG TPA: hypothetical protein VD694_05990 [Nitrososphaeraceae archaeon]|nr:hypothetical protein [Nitrososphaeraceae archaeon]
MEVRKGQNSAWYPSGKFIMDIFSSVSKTICVCCNSKFPSQLLSLEITKKTIAAKSSLIEQRYLIEVVKDNIASCRNLIEVVGRNNSNFRHSDEVEANFVVSEKEYLGSIILRNLISRRYIVI